MKKNNDNVKNMIKEVTRKTYKAKGKVLTEEELEQKANEILEEKEKKQLAEKEKRRLERKKKAEEKRRKEEPKTVDVLANNLNNSLDEFTKEIKSHIQAFENSRNRCLNEYDMEMIARQVFYTLNDFQKNIIGYLRNREKVEDKRTLLIDEDLSVEYSLLKCALGYFYEEQEIKIVKEEFLAEDGKTVLKKEIPKVITVKKEVKADKEAQKYWLKMYKNEYKDLNVKDDIKLLKLRKKELEKMGL